MQRWAGRIHQEFSELPGWQCSLTTRLPALRDRIRDTKALVAMWTAASFTKPNQLTVVAGS